MVAAQSSSDDSHLPACDAYGDHASVDKLITLVYGREDDGS